MIFYVILEKACNVSFVIIHKATSLHLKKTTHY